MRRTIKLTTFIIILSTLNSFGQAFNGARLDSLFKALSANQRAMGSVSVSRGGRVIYSKAFGFAKLAGAPQRANTLTQYRIGSISKMFTAVMIMQLVEEHKLKLITPLSQFFPQVPNAAKITIDELLSHRSGIHNFTDDADYNTYSLHPVSKAGMLSKITRYRPDFNPGQKSYYSNTNYLLLGYIIEQLTGKPYSTELQLRICNKIGLQHTHCGTDKPQANEALSYNFNGYKWMEVPRTELSVTGGAGAVVSTPTDMAAFISALFRGKLINQVSVGVMCTVTGKLGRGMVQIPVADQTAYGHFGMVDGFKNTLLYLPQSDVALAACFNSANTNDNAVVNQTLMVILSQLYQSPTLPAAQLAKYEGTYSSPQLPIKIVLRAVNGRLVLQSGNRPALILESISPTRFRFSRGDMTLDFTILGNNQVREFTLKQANSVYGFVRE
jgi:D-alanyl-D-alanine carboxypeptidase